MIYLSSSNAMKTDCLICSHRHSEIKVIEHTQKKIIDFIILMEYFNQNANERNFLICWKFACKKTLKILLKQNTFLPSPVETKKSTRPIKLE